MSKVEEIVNKTDQRKHKTTSATERKNLRNFTYFMETNQHETSQETYISAKFFSKSASVLESLSNFWMDSRQSSIPIIFLFDISDESRKILLEKKRPKPQFKYSKCVGVTLGWIH